MADLATANLADGVNLSQFTTTPMYRQAMDVFTAVRVKDMLDCAFWRDFISSGKADGAGKPAATATAADREAIAAAQQKLTEATQQCYALNTPHAHTVTLTPLEKPTDPYQPLVAQELSQAFLSATLTPVAVDWNAMTLLGKEVVLNISNPDAVAHTGTVNWSNTAGWQISPAQTTFTVEAGKDLRLSFAVSSGTDRLSLPPPTVTLRWRWAKAWPYPMQKTLEMEVLPRLTIAHAKTPVTMRGKLDEWADATSFDLDNSYFYDQPVPGKKALWGGPADLSARVMLKWDEKAFYVAVRVRDDEHLQNSPDNLLWSQDAVHLAALLAEGDKEGRIEMAFAALPDHNRMARFMSTVPATADGPDVSYNITQDAAAGACIYEMAFPWNRLGPFTPVAGKSFRFTLAIPDVDSQPGKGFNYMGWTPGINYGKNPYDMATLVLGQ